MNVHEIMTENPAFVQPTTTLYDTLNKMEAVGCHHMPVLSNSGHLVGIVSASDCLMSLGETYTKQEGWKHNPQAKLQVVRDAMTTAPIIIEPNAPAINAARLMLENYIGCLPVMRGETLVGIITKSDILMAFIVAERRAKPFSNE
ncbi:MAG: CBS domain-containing protein [Chloroflexi bacterium]|nr:MAG: hypothetical protein CUN54_07920 [Phototrophicales bacterium]RMF76606.1 MAG: CBS domain-containing protein [Chloroflexota bacterium]